MRISDWSSDVCSSDLTSIVAQPSTMMMATLCMIILMTIAVLVVLGDVLFGPIGIGSLAIGIASLGFFWLAAGYDERSPWTVKQESDPQRDKKDARSEEHTSELQSLMRNSYAVFCLTKK